MGTKVRILAVVVVAGVTYRPNQVVDLPPNVAKQLAADGQVDPHKDAVNYCIKELGAKVIVHADPAEAPQEPQPADPLTEDPQIPGVDPQPAAAE